MSSLLLWGNYTVASIDLSTSCPWRATSPQRVKSFSSLAGRRNPELSGTAWLELFESMLTPGYLWRHVITQRLTVLHQRFPFDGHGGRCDIRALSSQRSPSAAQKIAHMWRSIVQRVHYELRPTVPVMRAHMFMRKKWKQNTRLQ